MIRSETRHPRPLRPERRRRFVRALVAAGAALGVLAGCGAGSEPGTALERAMQDVERTSSPVDTTTTTPAKDDAQDELIADLRDSELVPNVSRRDAACVVTGLRDRFGDDQARAVIEAATGDESLDPDDAQAAGDIVLGCVDPRAWLRATVMRSFDTTSTEGECIATNWTEGEIGGLLATKFMLFDDLDDTQVDLTRRLLSETGRCLPEPKIKKLLIGSAMAAPSTSYAQATCYADARIAAAGPAEAVRVEFSGYLTLGEATSVFDSLDHCLDVRAQFRDGLEQEGYSSEDAACVAHELTDRDLRAIMLELMVGENLGRESDLAFDHFDAADVACGAATTGT